MRTTFTGFPGSLFDELDLIQHEMDMSFGERGLASSIRAAAGRDFPPLNVGATPEAMEVFVFVPDVSNKGRNVLLDNDTLLIDGDASLDMPEDMEAVYADLRTPHFRRSFALNRKLDTVHINAKLKDGVLTVTIPKAEVAKPHRIGVRTG